MRLEIMIGNSGTLIRPIKGNRVLIGSSESCDIILSANSISRKHLIVGHEDDQYFVIDQGSTNGSYINEERLVPGRRVEFTSFFPVRLGDEVLVSLISDDETDLEETLSPGTTSSSRSFKSDHDSTSVISLKQLKEVKTDHLIKKREERRKQIRKKKASPPPQPVAPKKKKKIKIDGMSIMAVLLVAAAGYYQFFMGAEIEEVPVQPVETAPPVVKKIEVPVKNYHLVEAHILTSREELVNKISNMKCLTDVEQYFCQTFIKNPEVPFGAFQVGTMIHTYLNVGPYLEAANKYVSFPDPTKHAPERFAILELHAKNVLALNFIINVIPEDFKTDLVEAMKMTFSFFKLKETGPELYFALAITPEAIRELRTLVQPEQFEMLRNPGNEISTMASKYYQLY